MSNQLNTAAEEALGSSARRPSKPDIEEHHVVDVSRTELIDRGREGKFIFVPSKVRAYIYADLDINGLFSDESLERSDDERLPDVLRRKAKNQYSVPTYSAIIHLSEIKAAIEEDGYKNISGEDRVQLEAFIRIVEAEEKALQAKFGKVDSTSLVTAEELAAVLNAKGQLFSYNDGQVTFGFISREAKVQHGWLGSSISVKGLMNVSFGDGIVPVGHSFRLPYFYGQRSLKEVGISLLSTDKNLYNHLVERGKRYAELTSVPSYRVYKGAITRRSWWNERRFKADGRVMVDIAAMRNIDPDYDEYFGWERYSDQERSGGKRGDFTDQQYASMAPYVYGFSFASKVWGEMTMDSLSEINFREDAYDMLVMDKDRKDMIFALVDNSVGGAKDIIDGKGGGCIFLLAGPPGGGKTLTAEAIAESLKRPLYMVGVGELGTDVTALEESLRKILDVAATWNAVLLIDECDIFMEQRTNMDVERNAMVGVFLRLLEYHPGVLFLTTNRADNLDKAFYSRISVALHYHPLGSEERKIVWTNLLKVYGVEGIDVEQLAHHELNGRKIKGVIRIAQALAAAENRPVEIADFNRVIDLEQEFQEAVRSN